MDWAIYWQLPHVAVHLRLVDFFSLSACNVFSADINAFSQLGDDCGCRPFSNPTIQGRATAPPTNCMAMSQYLAHKSPRLLFLLHIHWAEGTFPDSRQHPQFLVYYDWSLVGETFLSGLWVEFVIIRAGMSIRSHLAAANSPQTVIVRRPSS
ncbi:HelicaseC-terminal [Penicillium sp. IBT 31633x]|nr:HelicaseC-terminal [Penicillium sp. IBT 31633x]